MLARGREHNKMREALTSVPQDMPFAGGTHGKCVQHASVLMTIDLAQVRLLLSRKVADFLGEHQL